MQDGLIFEASPAMKKIDKLILSSFLGPFVMTFLVVVFILLLQHMLKYFDDIVGKDLGWDVVGQLLFYFAIFMTPIALPLAVLLSSLITFGNLSEHFEITAVKSLGISLSRSLRPLFFFTIGLTFFAFYVNNYWVPKAALEAYSLMYDIKQKKPALDLQEGTFYAGIPDISIKVGRKFPDGVSLKDVIIYDHRGRTGNKQVTIADSGRMFTILNEQYLKLELYNGYDYTEGNEQSVGNNGGAPEALRKTRFGKTEIVFDLSSFGLSRTDKKWFQGNRIMRNIKELDTDMDSMSNEVKGAMLAGYQNKNNMFNFHLKEDTVPLPSDLRMYKKKLDSLAALKGSHSPQGTPAIGGAPYRVTPTAKISAKARHASDSLFRRPFTADEVTGALNVCRIVKSQLLNMNANLDTYHHEYMVFQTQWHKILSYSFACIAMFLIGAPLGAIIKKGGLGVPVIVSIFFFILFYIINSTGEKWAEQDKITVPVGLWTADVLLSLIGLFFLRQARVDARLFDADFYRVVMDKIKSRFGKARPAAKPA